MKIGSIKLSLGSWDTWRITRMAMGVIALGVSIKNADLILGFTGVFLIVHAYINACAACQGGACEVPQNKKK